MTRLPLFMPLYSPACTKVITTHVNGVRNRWEWVRLDNLEQDEIEALMNVPVYPIRRTVSSVVISVCCRATVPCDAISSSITSVHRCVS